MCLVGPQYGCILGCERFWRVPRTKAAGGPLFPCPECHAAISDVLRKAISDVKTNTAICPPTCKDNYCGTAVGNLLVSSMVLEQQSSQWAEDHGHRAHRKLASIRA